jgi:hypothetical protein
MCNASFSQSARKKCEWGQPTTTAQSNILPFDHLLGVKKVYEETVTLDDMTHIFEAQTNGSLLGDCILNILAIVAIIVHSSRLKYQKAYDLLGFMRNPTVFNDTIGFGAGRAKILASAKSFSAKQEKDIEEKGEESDSEDESANGASSENNGSFVGRSDDDDPYSSSSSSSIPVDGEEAEEKLSLVGKAASFFNPLYHFFRREYFLNVEPEAVIPGSFEFEKERPKPGVDWYGYIIVSQFLTLIYVAFFQLDPTRTIQQWENSTLNIGYVTMLFIISLLMVMERMMYLYRAIVMKTLVHISWVIFVVVMVHSNVYTEIFRLQSGESLKWFAWIQLPYFFFSSLQISYGYPPFVGGRLVVETEDWYFWALLYLPFRGFPFLFEIKLLLDYFCTQTTFFLQDFIKYEDIRANIYVIGVNLDWNHQESRARGQPKPFCSRCCSGGLCFSLIWLALFLPLFLFTSGTTPKNDLNSIQTVTLQVSIDTFPNFFRMDSNIDKQNQGRMEPGVSTIDCVDEANITKYVCLEKKYPKLRNIPYSDKKEYESNEVQKLNISTSSGSNWPITIDSREILKTILKKIQTPMDFTVFLGFTRTNGDVFSHTYKYPIENKVRLELIEVLSKNSSVSQLKTYVSLPNFLPTFIRLPRTGSAYELTVNLASGEDSVHKQTCILKLGSPLGSTESQASSLNITDALISNATVGVNETTDEINKVTEKELDLLTEYVRKQNQMYQEKLTQLGVELQNQAQDYWSIQCGVEVQNALGQRAPQHFHIYAFSAQVSLGQLVAGGVISLYSLLILYLSSFVRGMFTGGSANTMFYDWPRHDVMKQYVVKIAECRALAGLNDHDLKVFRRGEGTTNAKDKVTPLEAEEEYFRELVDIYRRPDLLYERTGPYRHYFGVDSQREAQFHKQMRNNHVVQKDGNKIKVD